MRRLVILTMGLALFTGCFSLLKSETKVEQYEWLAGQNEILLKQLTESDGFWFAGENEILLEHFTGQLEQLK